jgi:predicted MPP superfamily phosphohydrolase
MANGRFITRRRVLKFATIASGIGFGTGLYTWRWEPHWVEIVHRSLSIRSLPFALIGKRMVQLSDLHVGPRVDDAYLVDTFNKVKKLSPELVVYTGDFTSYESAGLGHAKRLFANLPTGSMGTFGVLGNHDYGTGWSDSENANGVARLATEAGVTVLRNEAAEVAGLRVVGLDDLWAGRFTPGRVLADLQPETPALVLSHNPDTVDLPVWDGFEGPILAGHTHGGQCKPPFLPPPLLPVQNKRYSSGEFLLSENRRLYINRGIGHLLRVRFNVRPEITVFKLERV